MGVGGALLGFVLLVYLYFRPSKKRHHSGRGRTSHKTAGRVNRADVTGVRADVFSALKNMGYKPGVASRAARSARGSDFDTILRNALKGL
jgi:Holliday junction resolvasome RuvABC DNA-binding subunit